MTPQAYLDATTRGLASPTASPATPSKPATLPSIESPPSLPVSPLSSPSKTVDRELASHVSIPDCLQQLLPASRDWKRFTRKSTAVNSFEWGGRGGLGTFHFIHETKEGKSNATGSTRAMGTIKVEFEPTRPLTSLSDPASITPPTSPGMHRRDSDSPPLSASPERYFLSSPRARSRENSWTSTGSSSIASPPSVFSSGYHSRKRTGSYGGPPSTGGGFGSCLSQVSTSPTFGTIAAPSPSSSPISSRKFGSIDAAFSNVPSMSLSGSGRRSYGGGGYQTSGAKGQATAGWASTQTFGFAPFEEASSSQSGGGTSFDPWGNSSEGLGGLNLNINLEPSSPRSHSQLEPSLPVWNEDDVTKRSETPLGYGWASPPAPTSSQVSSVKPQPSQTSPSAAERVDPPFPSMTPTPTKSSDSNPPPATSTTTELKPQSIPAPSTTPAESTISWSARVKNGTNGHGSHITRISASPPTATVGTEGRSPRREGTNEKKKSSSTGSSPTMSRSGSSTGGGAIVAKEGGKRGGGRGSRGDGGAGGGKNRSSGGGGGGGGSPTQGRRRNRGGRTENK